MTLLLPLGWSSYSSSSVGLGHLAVKVERDEPPPRSPGVPGSAHILPAHPTLAMNVSIELDGLEMCLSMYSSKNNFEKLCSLLHNS